jgi:hypothetical protein
LLFIAIVGILEFGQPVPDCALDRYCCALLLYFRSLSLKACVYRLVEELCHSQDILFLPADEPVFYLSLNKLDFFYFIAFTDAAFARKQRRSFHPQVVGWKFPHQHLCKGYLAFRAIWFKDKGTIRLQNFEAFLISVDCSNYK